MKTVLVIDNDMMFQLILAECLRKQRYFSIAAKDGYEGVQFARSHRPDLIFCDVNLPLLDGIEVLRQVRSDVNTAAIPFFFLTLEVNLNLGLMREFGVSGFISKEAQIQELWQMLPWYRFGNS